VLHDPYAVPIVNPAFAQQALEDETSRGFIYRKFSRSLRASVVARSRFAEDNLAAAFFRGTRQYVILGAGLDTFSLRNPLADPANPLKIFEVDHPATQTWKRELLQNANLTPPATLTFVPVNFEQESLAQRLTASGFNPAAPATFSMLGVVPYLNLKAFRQTLAFVTSLPATTDITFDYATDPADLGFLQRQAFDMLAKRVAAAGEPFQLLLRPEKMHAELAAVGFTAIEDLTSAEMNGRYFQNREDKLAIAGTVGHFLHAGK